MAIYQGLSTLLLVSRSIAFIIAIDCVKSFASPTRNTFHQSTYKFSEALASPRTSSPLGKLATTMAGTSLSATSIPTWEELSVSVSGTPVGEALDKEVEIRKEGRGSAYVQNELRLFGSEGDPQITLYRDHAGWCPYCQKMMLLVEEKRVPVKISLVPMRSYGDKPREFIQKVPSGLLPAMEVNGQIITESQVIMELLDQWHPESDGYLPMLPEKDDRAGLERYNKLARLERDLFSWWCTLVFRPEGPRLGGGGGDNLLSRLMGGGSNGDADGMSGAMEGFLDCLRKVDKELQSTAGPWFFGGSYPTMMDFIYVSHVERMLASCAYWKGLNLRDPKWKLSGLTAWLDAFEKREAYLAFKSDYYTHVMDIPPQYGPGYDGGFENDRKKFSASVSGSDSTSWYLPLPHDDPLQPLYRGPPLPVTVLEAAGLVPAADGSYLNGSTDTEQNYKMEMACRRSAAWKLAGNGENVAKFASRGGPSGAKNPRKTFGAPLADPYAESDENVAPYVDAALRTVCNSLLDETNVSPTGLPDGSQAALIQAAVPAKHIEGVISSLAYLRDRIGVPRDMPFAAARYFRAYLNWGIDALNER